MSNPDWMDWLETATEQTSTSPETPAQVLPIRRPARPRAITLPPATLVVGACGGAGATTTALGLANTVALARGNAVAIDATAGGGDIADRGAEFEPSVTSLEMLLADGTVRDDVFAGANSPTSVGAGVLHQSGEHAGYLNFPVLDAYLREQGTVGVYDAGPHLRSSHIRPFWSLGDRAAAPIVLTVPCRADAFNRMRYSLSTIAELLMHEQRLISTVVVISHQRPDVATDDVAVLRDYLEHRVSAVLDVPYDDILAIGGWIDHRALRPDTVAAYDSLTAAVVAAADASVQR